MLLLFLSLFTVAVIFVVIYWFDEKPAIAIWMLASHTQYSYFNSIKFNLIILVIFMILLCPHSNHFFFCLFHVHSTYTLFGRSTYNNKHDVFKFLVLRIITASENIFNAFCIMFIIFKPIMVWHNSTCTSLLHFAL